MSGYWTFVDMNSYFASCEQQERPELRGLGPNIFLAKVASDLQKPRGLSVITPEDIPHKLLGLALTDWPGISRGMEARFHRYGVHTTAEMYLLRIEEMRDVFGGVVGERWWKSLRSLHVDLPPIKRYQIGHSNVLAPEFRTLEGATAVVFRMLEKAAERLRHEGYHARRLEVHVMSATEPFWSRHADFLPCNRTGRFVKILRYLWNPPTQVPKSVGVNLQKIIPDAEVTLNMFDDPRRANLEAVIDRLNRRYGRTTITRAIALRATQYLSHDEFHSASRLIFAKRGRGIDQLDSALYKTTDGL